LPIIKNVTPAAERRESAKVKKEPDFRWKLVSFASEQVAVKKWESDTCTARL